LDSPAETQQTQRIDTSDRTYPPGHTTGTSRHAPLTFSIQHLTTAKLTPHELLYHKLTMPKENTDVTLQ
ncbi:Hypothetical predicted protein, partial [Pelobates cultripes]